MKKITSLFVCLIMLTLVSCTKGLDIDKCEKIAQKDASEITVKDFEFFADQLEMLYDDYSKASDCEDWVIHHMVDNTRLMVSLMTIAANYTSTGKEIPESVDKRIEKACKKIEAVFDSGDSLELDVEDEEEV